MELLPSSICTMVTQSMKDDYNREAEICKSACIFPLDSMNWINTRIINILHLTYHKKLQIKILSSSKENQNQKNLAERIYEPNRMEPLTHQ